MTLFGAIHKPGSKSQLEGYSSNHRFVPKADEKALFPYQTAFPHLLIWALVLLCCLGSFQPLQAREVPLKEVPITLYNKSVTGYRLLMDRPLDVVTEQITDHVSGFTSLRPFQYERTIIYENLRYVPVSRDRQISLYYILRDLGNQLSEVTLVVMYDYRRSVNSREFPDLSAKIQIDLAQLLRKTTGDLLKAGNRLIDDSVLQNAVEPDQPVVEHFREEEVENEGVLLRDDPFRPINESDANPVAVKPDPVVDANGNPDLAKMQRRIRDLESRERSLITETQRLQRDQANMERRQEQLMAKLSTTRGLQDSVARLNEQVEKMAGHYYLSDDFSVSSDAAAEMQNLQRRIQLMDDRYDRLKAEKDSLARAHQEVIAALSNSGSGTRRRVEQKRILEKEKAILEKENARLQAQLDQQVDDVPSAVPLDSLVELLAREKQQQAKLFRQYSDLQASLQSSEVKLAKANGRLTSLDQEVTQLQLGKRNLQSELDAALKDGTAGNTAKINADSLKLLKVRLEGYSAMETRFNQQSKDLAQQQQSLQQNAQTIRNLNTKIKQTAVDLKRSQDYNAQLSTELQASQQEAQQANSKLENLQEAQSLSAVEQQRLQSKVTSLEATLKTSLRKNTRIEDSIRALNQQQQQLARTIRQRDEALDGMSSQKDSLAGILSRTRDANLKLGAELSELELANDSLRRLKANPADQQAFIREQFARLEDWEAGLKTREAEASDQEKLIGQQQRTLDRKAKTLGEQESRLADLEEREKQIRLKEQQLGTGAPVEFTVREGRVLEFGKQVPVFIVDSDVDSRAATRRVTAFMLQRDELLDEQFPDLVFQSVDFPGLSTLPVTIQVRIDGKGTGSTLQISFLEQSGAYVGPNSEKEQIEAARKLAGQMIRYKF